VGEPTVSMQIRREPERDQREKWRRLSREHIERSKHVGRMSEDRVGPHSFAWRSYAIQCADLRCRCRHYSRSSKAGLLRTYRFSGIRCRKADLYLSWLDRADSSMAERNSLFSR